MWAEGVMLGWSGTLDAEGPLLLSLDLAPDSGTGWSRLDVAPGMQPDEALYHPAMVWTGSSVILDAALEYGP